MEGEAFVEVIPTTLEEDPEEDRTATVLFDTFTGLVPEKEDPKDIPVTLPPPDVLEIVLADIVLVTPPPQ
jgi:hypothetical protein